MSTFDFLIPEDDKLNPTRKYELDFVRLRNEKGEIVSPILTLRSMTKLNPQYLDAALNSSRGKDIDKKKINAELINRLRDTNIDLVSRYVVQSWENVYDSKGKPVKFSQSECKDFLQAISKGAGLVSLDDMFEFAQDVTNFIDVIDVMTEADAEELGKS
jgi:hypothetical protein